MNANNINKDVKEFINGLYNDYKPLWWPKYLFHFSDILNIIKILNEGCLYSRNIATEKGLVVVDSASKSVLPSTNEWVLDYVRLYFRPKTPTLYLVEGFCPNGICSEKHKSHCPVPVYLLFNSVKVLSLSNIKFSNGNLASENPKIYDKVEDLPYLPFDLIYHDSFFNETLKRNIIYHRHAETIVPDYLPLDGFLSDIICRSEAERETLLNLLSDDMYKKYSGKIAVSSAIFNCQRQYISKVSLYKDAIKIQYNKNSYHFCYSYKLEFNNGERKSKKEEYPIRSFKLQFQKDEYIFKIFIDNHIAYLGKYIDSPF